MLEIKRDLATYEVNFLAYRDVRRRLERAAGAVKESSEKLAMASSRDDGELGASGSGRGPYAAAAGRILKDGNVVAGPGASGPSNGQLSDTQIARILSSLQQIQGGQLSRPPSDAVEASPERLSVTSPLHWQGSSLDGGGSPSPGVEWSSPPRTALLARSPLGEGLVDPCPSVPVRPSEERKILANHSQEQLQNLRVKELASNENGQQAEHRPSMAWSVIGGLALRKSKAARGDHGRDGAFRRGSHAGPDPSAANLRN